jgi:hypothetical protein
VLSVKVIASKGAAAKRTPSERLETKLADHNLLNALPTYSLYLITNGVIAVASFFELL